MNRKKMAVELAQEHMKTSAEVGDLFRSLDAEWLDFKHNFGKYINKYAKNWNARPKLIMDMPYDKSFITVREGAVWRINVDQDFYARKKGTYAFKLFLECRPEIGGKTGEKVYDRIDVAMALENKRKIRTSVGVTLSKLIVLKIRQMMIEVDAFLDTPVAPDFGDVASLLWGLRTPAGTLKKRPTKEPGLFEFEPSSRQRLDHYGNDGDGWDGDAWEEEYVTPLQDAVEAKLKTKFALDLFHIDVDEKGFVNVELSPKGRSHFGVR